MGTEKIGSRIVLLKFRGEKKLIALLNAIGSVCMEISESGKFLTGLVMGFAVLKLLVNCNQLLEIF